MKTQECGFTTPKKMNSNSLENPSSISIHSREEVVDPLLGFQRIKEFYLEVKRV
jgi:hypothetical protein